MSASAVRTVAVLELRQRVRSTRWKVMLVVWGIVLVLLCTGMAALTVADSTDADDAFPLLYELVLCFVLGIGLVIAPTLSATSVNGDRADATLALLQATALRSAEIVVGKLLAAWAAALAFLAVALPFLLVLTIAGGSTWRALAGHVLVLVVTLGAVCAIGLGFSAATARPSASAVLTYLVVVALTIGTPLATAIASPAVRSEQRVVIYRLDYDASTNDKRVCRTEPETHVRTVEHSERIWWMLIPNPFTALGDITVRAPAVATEAGHFSGDAPLITMGEAIDRMRDPHPEEITERRCESDDYYREYERADNARHIAFWPASLVVILALGAWSVARASRRLRTPARTLARGTRVA